MPKWPPSADVTKLQRLITTRRRNRPKQSITFHLETNPQTKRRACCCGCHAGYLEPAINDVSVWLVLERSYTGPLATIYNFAPRFYPCVFCTQLTFTWI